MIDRFEGDKGRLNRVEALLAQKLVAGNSTLAEELAEAVEVRVVGPGEVLIDQDAETDDVFFIFGGICDVSVNGRVIAKRGPGDHVGEMTAIQPTQRRSARVTAAEEMIVGVLSADQFNNFGSRHPQIYRSIARELSRRLLQRNSTINAYREKIRVFIICSVEALPIARILVNAFEFDPFHTEVWNHGVFKVANYTLQDLEDAVDNSDFAIAIAHADDVTTGRNDETWPSPRDNVVFELGLFMGRLGRSRAILMEPRGQGVKLPSDLAGVQTIAYRFERGQDAAALMAPACNNLREHILKLGANNG